MNTSRQQSQLDSYNCRPIDFLPYRREPEEKTKNKRGAPTPTPLPSPFKEKDDNPRYFEFLSQAQKNLFPNYSSSTKATLASIDDMKQVRPYLTLIQNLEIVTEGKAHNHDMTGKDLSHKMNQNTAAELTRIHESNKLSKENMIRYEQTCTDPMADNVTSPDDRDKDVMDSPVEHANLATDNRDAAAGNEDDAAAGNEDDNYSSHDEEDKEEEERQGGS